MASAPDESDLAFLQACRQRLTDEEWRMLLLIAQVLSDAAFPSVLKTPLTEILHACTRLGTVISFDDGRTREDFHRLYDADGITRITLHKPPERGSPFTGITFEGKAFPEDPKRRKRIEESA